MSFKDQGWAHRFKAMGDEAEGIFEEVWPTSWERFGLARPAVQVSGLPPFVRYTPDYLTSSALVEVQGFGSDQRFKLKVDKWMALHTWLLHMPVRLFVWDSKNKRYGDFPIEALDPAVPIKRFPEGNPYLEVPAKDLPIESWTKHEAPT